MKLRSVLSIVLALLMVLSFAACGAAEKTEPAATAAAVASTPEEQPAAEATVAAEPAKEGVPTIDTIKLGEDYKDIKASLKFLTHRTDIVESKLAGYITEFKKLYPNVEIKYEAITDYAQDVTVRLTTDNWGDICMIPTTVDKKELPNLFVPYGKKEALDQTYAFLTNFSYDGTVYGMPSTANAQGIVYNKKVFADAGITAVPKTPDEFINALKAIKTKTKAIPLYTNFAAGWTMGAWDAYIGGSATGDADFMWKVCHMKNPFTDKGNGTGPYAVYNVLYEAVKQGLVEDDPTTTDWEGCKPMINKGEIGTLVLGSWAVTQMQGAGPNPQDIGYMPFPITVNGKQCASAGPDYTYGINVKSSQDNQIASMLYVKWLTEKSQFAFTEGGLPIVKADPLPDVYKDFNGIEFVVDNPAPVGEETLFNDMNTKSEVGINKENTHVQSIVENALSKGKAMKDIADDWNAKWTKAQEELKVEVNQ